jgi:hypothetical protein
MKILADQILAKVAQPAALSYFFDLFGLNPSKTSLLLLVVLGGFALFLFIYGSMNAGTTVKVHRSPAIVFDPLYGNVIWQTANLPPLAPLLTVLDPTSMVEFNGQDLFRPAA